MYPNGASFDGIDKADASISGRLLREGFKRPTQRPGIEIMYQWFNIWRRHLKEIALIKSGAMIGWLFIFRMQAGTEKAGS